MRSFFAEGEIIAVSNKVVLYVLFRLKFRVSMLMALLEFTPGISNMAS